MDVTLEELCECSAEQLEAMTDAQLTEHFKKYFPVTRPEQARVVRQTAAERQAPAIYLSPQKKAALAALQDDGVDLSFMRKRFGRK